MQYLYFQKIEAVQLQDDYTSDKYHMEDNIVVELWTMAGMLRIPKLQNLALSTIVAIQETCGLIPIAVLHDVYRLTSPGSKLRKYFIENCACNVPPEKFILESKNFPHEMLAELAGYMANYSWVRKSKGLGEVEKLSKNTRFVSAENFAVCEDED